MTNEITKYDDNRYKQIEKRVLDLPSISNEALSEITQGLYAGKPLFGTGGLFTQLLKDLTQVALQAEMDAHLSDTILEEGSNRRNGISRKTMRTGGGSFELETPRDRNGSFDPQLIKKRQTILNEELDNKILALYGLGSSYSDISSHLSDIYGVEVSAATINSVTDKLIPLMSEWRSRPLN